MLSSGQFIQQKERDFQEMLDNNIPLKFKDISRKGKMLFLREKWTFMQQTNLPEKVFVFERLRLVGVEGKATHIPLDAINKAVEYRFGYFIVGKIGKRKDKWTWAQFCPIIPTTDFDKLLQQAKRDGVII